jgi:predicted ATPase
LVRGPAGIGKSALLAVVAADAGADGSAVLWTSGVQAEASLPYAALERLLHGLRDRLQGLPESQRNALRAGLGMSQSAVPDQFLVGLAVLSLLSDVACAGPVVVVVDDARWLDCASAEVFGFVARRIGSARSVLRGMSCLRRRERCCSWPRLTTASSGPRS